MQIFLSAPAQGGGHADGAGVFGIEQHEPGRAEGIAEGKPQDHPAKQQGKAAGDLVRQQTRHQGGEEKAHQIAAGDAHQRPETALEAGEHRQANGAQQQIDRHGHKAQLPAEKGGQQAHRKGLQGEGHPGGQQSRHGDPGAYRDQGGAHGGQRHVADRKGLVVHRKHLIHGIWRSPLYAQNGKCQRKK